MRNKDVISYLGLWEKLNNPNFKGIEFTTFENQAGRNSFYLSPQKWIETTNAIGMISKSGNNGGTFAHRDIAFEFASWYNQTYEVSSMNCTSCIKAIQIMMRMHQFTAERQFTTAPLSNHAACFASCQLSLDKNAEMEYNENTKKLPGNGHFLIDS